MDIRLQAAGGGGRVLPGARLQKGQAILKNLSTRLRGRILKRILVAGCFLICGVCLSCPVINKGRSVGLIVKEFYGWYIHLQSELKYPLLDECIYCYVEKKMVDALRSAYSQDRLPGDVDYFTKAQDFDESDWESHIFLHSPFAIDKVIVVPVTFGSFDKTSVLVFLRKQNDGWRIMKVDDTEEQF